MRVIAGILLLFLTAVAVSAVSDENAACTDEQNVAKTTTAQAGHFAFWTMCSQQSQLLPAHVIACVTCCSSGLWESEVQGRRRQCTARTIVPVPQLSPSRSSRSEGIMCLWAFGQKQQSSMLHLSTAQWNMLGCRLFATGVLQCFYDHDHHNARDLESVVTTDKEALPQVGKNSK